MFSFFRRLRRLGWMMKETVLKLVLSMALVLVGSLLSQSCMSRQAPQANLQTPEFVPQSQPDSLAQTGIGQDPEKGGIFLQWYRVVGASGYRLYRSDTKGGEGNPIDFSLVGNVTLLGALNDTSTVDASNIVEETRYYYYLVAYRSDGSHSSPSDTINYELLNRANLSHPADNSTLQAAGLYFNWGDNLDGGWRVIRVRDMSAVPVTVVWLSKRFHISNSYPTRKYDFDSTASAQLKSGHSYQWRIDRFVVDSTGRPYEGSRSVWWTFTVK